MALTQQQKAENKAAGSVKRRAHTERYRLLRAAIEAAEASPDVLAAKTEADAAHDAAERAWQDREHRMQVLREQIKAIERQIEEVRNERAAFMARDAERAAWSRWRTLKDAKVADAEGQFPDMAGAARWSVAAWGPPQEVLEAMGAARAAVHAA